MLIFLTVILMIFSPVGALNDLIIKVVDLKTNLAKMESENKIDPNEHDTLEKGLGVMSSIQKSSTRIDFEDIYTYRHRFLSKVTDHHFPFASAESDLRFLLNLLNTIKPPTPTKETDYIIKKYRNLQKSVEEKAQSRINELKSQTDLRQEALEFMLKDKVADEDLTDKTKMDKIGKIGEEVINLWDHLSLDDLMDMYNLKPDMSAFKDGYTPKNQPRNAQLLHLCGQSLEKMTQIFKSMKDFSELFYKYKYSFVIDHSEFWAILPMLCTRPFLPEALQLKVFNFYVELVKKFAAEGVNASVPELSYTPIYRLPRLAGESMKEDYPEHYLSALVCKPNEKVFEKLNKLREFVLSGFVKNAEEFGYTGPQNPLADTRTDADTIHTEVHTSVRTILIDLFDRLFPSLKDVDWLVKGVLITCSLPFLVFYRPMVLMFEILLG